jgi:hypothetical protein
MGEPSRGSTSGAATQDDTDHASGTLDTISRLRRVATTKSLPYHALARAWILDALRSTVTPRYMPVRDEAMSAQLNLKFDQVLLDSLKRHASGLRRPYHALAREYIETALEREEKELGIDDSPQSLPAMK